MPASGLPYDLTILGATGYTGQLVVQYLGKLRPKREGERLSLCVGARSKDAAEAMCGKLLGGSMKELDVSETRV